MYAGVPSREPSTVGCTSEPDSGLSVGSATAGEPAFHVPADRLGQAPVDHQRLTVVAQHDVARLQIAVQHPAAVGVADRIADVQEPSQ